MGVEDDIEAQERLVGKQDRKGGQGLTARLNEDKKTRRFGNPDFMEHAQLAVRCATGCVLGSLIVYIPHIYERVPAALAPQLPATLLFFCCYFLKNVGVTFSNCWRGVIATTIAVINIWMINGIFPDGVQPHHTWTDAAPIVGIIDFATVTLLLLYLNVSCTVMIVGLINHTVFMLAFMNPDSGATFWSAEHAKGGQFQVGTGIMAVITVLLAAFLAMVMICLPYPITAMGTVKNKSLAIAKQIQELFAITNEYYAGDHVANVVLDKISHEVHNVRVMTDDLDAAVSEGWWENFNFGNQGTIRARMQHHSKLLRKLHQLLYSMQIAAKCETFTQQHQDIMAHIKESLLSLSSQAAEVLKHVTIVATHGQIAPRDTTTFREELRKLDEAIKTLSEQFNEARKKYHVVEEKLLSVSFFVFVVTSFAKHVLADANMMSSEPAPEASSFFGDCWSGFKAIWKLANPNRHSFAWRYFTAIFTAFILAVTSLDFSATCPITAIVLISDGIGADIQKDLGRLQGVVLATVIPLQAHSWLCSGVPHPANSVLCVLVVFLYCSSCAYVYYSSPLFGFIACLMLVIGVTNLAIPCEGAVVSGAAVYAAILHAIIGVCLMLAVDLLAMSKMPSALCTQAVLDAMSALKSSLEHILDPALPIEDAPIDKIPECLSKALLCSKYAGTEPRFWKKNWHETLVVDVVECLKEMHRNLKAIIIAYPGDVQQIFREMSSKSSYINVKNDMMTTLHDCTNLVESVLHPTGGSAGIESLESTDNVDKLEELPHLVKDISKQLQFPDACQDLSADRLCRVSSTLECLDDTVKAMAHLQLQLVKWL